MVGRVKERFQAGDANPSERQSSYSPEDLASNKYGAEFGIDSLNKSKDICSLEQQLEDYINKQLGGTPAAPGNIDDFNKIRNFSEKPILNPKDPRLKTKDNITYYSSGDESFVKQALEAIKKGKLGAEQQGQIKKGPASSGTAGSESQPQPASKSK